MGIYSCCARLWCKVGWLGQREVGHIYSNPLLLLFIPPDVLLTFRPGATLRISRGAVIENTPVGRPGKAPLWVRIVSGDARGCQILLRLRIHTTINPRATGCT